MDREIVRSFDVFDTLIGRLHTHPQSTFELVEKKFPFPNFIILRMQAEQNSKGTLDEIYERFGEMTGLRKEELEKLKQFELETEFSQIFPILKNIQNVREGDILISDTYYDQEILRKLLSHVGMNQEVKLIVSRDGKASGQIWEKLKDQYLILLHLGDNIQADFQIPSDHRIPVKWFHESQYSKLEQAALHNNQRDMADLMRALKLMNPFPIGTPSNEIWEQQAQINVPILILYSLFLYDHCIKQGKTKLLFSSRDSCLLIAIFKKLFPNFESIYFYTSRQVYANPSLQYIEYVKSIYSDDAVIVDVNGTGEHCLNFFRKYFDTRSDYVVLICREVKYDISYVATEIGWKIEQVNYDIHGRLIDYTNEGPQFDDLEYDLQYIYPAHDCIRKCVELLPHFKFDKFDLLLIKDFFYVLEGTNEGINKYVKHSST